MNTVPWLTDTQIIAVLNSTKTATAIHITEDAIIQTANEAMLKVWGKDQRVIGKSLVDALPELKGQPFIDMFKRVWREGLTLSGTDTPATLDVDGQLQTFYFDFEYKAVKNDAGEVICILHTANDITERFLSKQREQDLVEELASANEELATMNEELTVTNEELNESHNVLKSLNHDLLESENQLKLAIDAGELGTFDLNPVTGRFTGNSRLKNWFGLNPEDEIPLANATDNIAPADRERVIAEIAEVMKFNSGGVYDIEYSIINPIDGISRFVRAKGKVKFNEDRHPVRFSGTLQDITEQKLKEQYKDDFISIASHELKTPITSLKATLQLLDKLKDNPVSPAVPKLIDQANRSMEKTNVLIDDLLNASRVNAGQLQLNRSLFSVSEMLEGCCNHVRTAGKHELVFEGDKTLKIYADEHRIDQVVVNMVNNAVKYAADSQKIYLIAEDLGNAVKISVKDSGPGISPDKIEFLFDRYYRSDYSGKQFSGLGLGLYISAEIVKKHNGQIGVDSEPGKGSTFWFTLPKS